MNKRLTLLTIFAHLFYCSSFAGTLQFEDVDTKKTTKEYSVLAFAFTADAVLITAQSGKKCELPFRHLIDPVRPRPSCDSEISELVIMEEELEVIREFFTNAQNYKIVCTLKAEEVIGFNFFGHTRVKGVNSLVYRGRAFNMAQYPAPEVEEESPASRLLEQGFRAIGKFLFKL